MKKEPYFPTTIFEQVAREMPSSIKESIDQKVQCGESAKIIISDLRSSEWAAPGNYICDTKNSKYHAKPLWDVIQKYVYDSIEVKKNAETEDAKFSQRVF